MPSATYPVIKSIKITTPASNANAREVLGDGQAKVRTQTSRDEDGHAEPYPASQLANSFMEKTDVTDIKSKRYFLKFAVPVALLSWFFDSFIHYFWYGELEFEIIPADGNELWMRSTIFVLLVAFGLFADYKSKTSIAESMRKNQRDNISRAKKQWELVIDTLPQLVIAMDDNARITRVNRTVETWGMGKVIK